MCHSFINAGLFQLFQRCECGSYAQRISVECSCRMNSALHYCLRCTYSGNRISRSYSLSKYHYVGCNTEVPLSAGKCKPKSSNNLIKNEYYAVFFSKLPHSLKITGHGHYRLGIVHCRFHYQARYLVAATLQSRFQHFEIIPRQNYDILRCSVPLPSRFHYTPRCIARSHVYYRCRM